MIVVFLNLTDFISPNVMILEVICSPTNVMNLFFTTKHSILYIPHFLYLSEPKLILYLSSWELYCSGCSGVSVYAVLDSFGCVPSNARAGSYKSILYLISVPCTDLHSYQQCKNITSLQSLPALVRFCFLVVAILTKR